MVFILVPIRKYPLRLFSRRFLKRIQCYPGFQFLDIIQINLPHRFQLVRKFHYADLQYPNIKFPGGDYISP